jgi:membrane-associated phospholipid phosphatase
MAQPPDASNFAAALALPRLRTPGDDALLAQRCLLLAVFFAVAGCVMLLFDLLLAHVLLADAEPMWTELRDVLGTLVKPAETFANGLGVLLLLVVLYAVDEAHRRGLLRAALVVYGTGLLANVGKLLVARARPKAYYREHFGQFGGNILDTFQGWLPLVTLGYAGQSFPSGHTATAVALAIVLSRRWPQGTRAFVMLACMSAMQRLAFGHHYVSDCLWGAALGCAVAAAFYHPQVLGQWFERFEARKLLGRTQHRQADAAARAARVMKRHAA